jgi:hypothetical protein
MTMRIAGAFCNFRPLAGIDWQSPTAAAAGAFQSFLNHGP